MEYFIISQKTKIPNTAELLIKADSPSKPKEEFSKDLKDTIKKVTTINVIANENSFYPDVIDGAVFIMSQDLKKVIGMYDEGPIWRCVLLSDSRNDKYYTYWLPLLDKIPCLSEKTEFYKDKSLKKLVLDPKKIGDNKIFRVDSIREKIVVVRLDIAESILRRNFQGVKLEKIECEGDEDIWQM